MMNLGIDGGREGKSLFLVAQALSGASICKYEMVGKSIELASEDGKKEYVGIKVDGDPDYIDLITGENVFLLLWVFLDLNEEFLEYDFDELDLDPTSKHTLKNARII